MKSMTISTRIDEPTKIAFSQVCEEVGLSPSQAMQLFAKAVVNYGGIPFAIKVPTPNATTIEAMQAFDRASTEQQSLETADSLLDLIETLDIEKDTKQQVVNGLQLEAGND